MGSLSAQVPDKYDPEYVRMLGLKVRLDSLHRHGEVEGLYETTNLTLRDVPLHEYVRAIGLEHKVNVYIADTPDIIMTHNLSEERVISVLLFVCKTFSFTLDITGTIIRFKPYAALPPPEPEKELRIQYDNGLLSYDLKSESLDDILRELSVLTGARIVTRPGVEGLLSGYLPPTELDKALELLFLNNGFRVSKSRRGYYVVSGGPQINFSEPVAQNDKTNDYRRNPRPNPTPPPKPKPKGRSDFVVEVFEEAGNEFISIVAEDADLGELVQTLFEESQVDYFIFEQLAGTVTISLDSGRLDQVLKYIFQGTDYTYKKDDDLYLVGGKELEGLRATGMVKLKYRPTNQAIELIPPRVTEEVEIVEYAELNKIIIHGPTNRVKELEQFLTDIDRPIPMVKIEMIVVEVDKTRLLATGIRAGLRNPRDSLAVTKQVLPGVDYTMTGPDINNILQGANIPVLSNIGRLSSNFYIQLRAQESQGNLKIKMKPVLSMLNGREATLTIGQTQYYLLDTQTASTGAVNNFQQFSQRFEKIEANITLTIKPYISDDNMVTLDVLPDFTTPVGSFTAEVPPTISTRKFDSTIRVRQGETVILGGLSQEETSDSGSGVPVLSRIPVLKWLFSSREKSKSESSLIIYITPVIYYN